MHTNSRFWTSAGRLTLAMLALAACPFALALQDGAETQAPANAEMAAAMKQAAAKGGEESKSRFPDFKEVSKDMQPTEGLFTLYRYDAKDQSKDPEKLLAKIPARLLTEDLLFATSISRGGQFTGWMWTDYVVRWEIVGNNLKMVVPDTNYILQKGKPVTDAVERTYNERYIASVPIVAMDGADPVIDLNNLLKTDIADVGFMGGSVRPDLSKWTKTKVFPDNVLIEAELAMTGRPAGIAALMGGGAAPKGGTHLGVSYSFRRLPPLGEYSARKADDRVGYFLTARMDWTKENDQRDTFERYINRWNLEKRDPSLEFSPPKKPITFIIEKTVPVQWRRWVRAGVLEWNKAYEKVGIVDAIVVQQQTDDNEFAEYDPEDARYNFFRWIVSGRAFAMGPSRVDPRSGQILDADIIMDDSIVRAWMSDFDVFAPATTAETKGAGFRMYAQEHPELLPDFLRDAHLSDESNAAFYAAQQKLFDNGHLVCSYARGLQQQINVAHSAMVATATGKKLPERFIGEVIRHVVSHEVGHTLGLRHNFKASSWLSLEDIKKRHNGDADEPTTASVMDYNPILFFADDTMESVKHYTSPAIGPYDYWAVEYGYGKPDKTTPEEKWLAQVAGRSNEDGLAYATDEDTMWIYSPDPLVNRFDASKDLVGWARTRIELCDKLLANLPEWSVKEDEPRYFMLQAFNTLFFDRATTFDYAARLVGGQYFNRDHHGQANARPAFELVDPDTQRQALKLLSETIFNDQFFKLDTELLRNLAPARWSHWGADPDMELDYPIHDRIALLQLSTLLDVTAPPVLRRVYDAELKSDAKDKFTAAELITTLRDDIWSGLEKDGREYSDADPFISSIDRNLQRTYLRIMMPFVRSTPGGAMPADLHSMICYAMRELSERIDTTLKANSSSGGKSKLDFASRAHLSECKSLIDRTLNAQVAAP
jgi:hypothetical protein